MERKMYQAPAMKWQEMEGANMICESLKIYDQGSGNVESKRGFYEEVDVNDPFAKPRSVWDNDADEE